MIPPSTPYAVSTKPTLTDTSTLSLHDALPIWSRSRGHDEPEAQHRTERTQSGHPARPRRVDAAACRRDAAASTRRGRARSEEHTSELQSRENLVCRLLLEKKKKAHQRKPLCSY